MRRLPCSRPALRGVPGEAAFRSAGTPVNAYPLPACPEIYTKKTSAFRIDKVVRRSVGDKAWDKVEGQSVRFAPQTAAHGSRPSYT